MTAKTRLRILLLEDDPADADLIRDLLEADYFILEVTRVQTRDEFVTGLENDGIDLILADYKLPSFDGISALRLALSARPDLPFIFVSGMLGEETAIEALKIGATDYVLKTRLARLAPAVHRALGEAGARADRKRAESALREQANLLSLAHDAIFVRDMDLIIKYWNPGAEALYGWTREEAEGKYSPELLNTVFPISVEQTRAELLREGHWEAEVVRTTKQGTQVVVATRWSVQRDDEGSPIAILETSHDVTERKRAEALLAGEKHVLEMLARGDSLPEILDSLCRLVEEQVSGVLASILLLEGNRLRHGAAPSLPETFTNAIDGVQIGPSEGSCGTAAYRGRPVVVADITTDALWAAYRDLALPHSLRACWSTPVFSSQGALIATFAMYYREPRRPTPRDQQIIEQITHLAGVAIERKLVYDQLRRKEAYLTEAQRLNHTGSWASNPKKREHGFYWSEEMFRIFGFDPQQPIDADAVWRRFHPEDHDRAFELVERAIAEKTDFAVDYRIVLPEGTLKHIHAIGHPVLDEKGQLLEYVGTAMDVTERKRAEEGNARLAAIVESSDDAIVGKDLNGVITTWNRGAERIFGYTAAEAIGQPVTMLMPPERVGEEREILEHIRNGESLEHYETVRRRKDGTLLDISLTVSPVKDSQGRVVGASKVARDISVRKQAEQEREKLRQLEADLAHINRVTMMGELAGSLAHEIKQPIAAAVVNAKTCARWLQRDVPDIPEACQAASRMVDDTVRAADIVERVHSLYRRGAPQRELVDLNEMIQHMVLLLNDRANQHSIYIRTQLEASLPATAADRVQLKQVLMNLILNGIEAMQHSSGELTVTSKVMEKDQLLISVSDSGVGISSEQADRIFEAFFTTKPQGTGMGLAISRRIVESHGGRLWVTSNSGPGATFHFTLPAVAEAHARIA